MRIGIDIDDTITDTHACINKFKSIEFPERNPEERLPENLFIPFIDKYRKVAFNEVKLKEGAVEALKEIKSLGHEIIIITSRPKEGEEITKKYFQKNNLPYDDMYIDVNDKGKLASQINIDLFIDDHLFICDQMDKYNIKVIKMKRKDEDNEKYLEFDSWKDIIDYIKNSKEV